MAARFKIRLWRLGGRDENLAAGRSALYRRASCNGAASLGKYADEMELETTSAVDPPHRRDWGDD